MRPTIITVALFNTMSFNETVFEPVTGYLGQVGGYFSSLTTAQRVLLLVVNLPILSIALNVLSQFVGRFSHALSRVVV